MKKFAVFLLLALLIFSLAACAREQLGYERTVNGETYLIDTKNHTLTHDGKVYTYSITEISSNAYARYGLLRVQYPDGTWYEREIDDDGYLGLSYEKTSSNYDENTYPRGADLCYALEKETIKAAVGEEDGDSSERNVIVFVSVFLILAGGVNVAFPQLGVYLKHAMWVKDAEPSEFAIAYSRVVGVIFIALGIGVLIFM